MSEGRDPLTIRSFSTSSFWPKLVVLVLLLAFVGLSFYSVYAFRAMSAFRNQGLDQEIAKSEAIQKDRQFAALDERLTDLDYKLNELKVYEETLKVLAQDVNQRLGLPAGVDLSGVWPVLASSVAWTWGGLNGQGGQDNSLKDGQDPSLSQAPPNPAEIIKGLHQDLDRLEASAAAIDLAINELTTILEESRGLLAVTPYDLPMTTYRVTSTFGWRRPPLGGGGA
ncbi:MAG: hypothetical protein LBI10_01350, partial [Deltaproteobacteria bacterium]|nr:hypothetical protein [Deltaproteobacteria bacterium]